MSKALRHMRERDVLLSYATDTDPWDEITDLFIDSGGYSLMLETGEHDSVNDYLDYVEAVDANIAAMQDYPCEPGILNEYDRTVADHQAMTVDRARANLNEMRVRGLNTEPMAVLQGWEPDDYLNCIDMFREAGVLTDSVFNNLSHRVGVIGGIFTQFKR